MVRKLGDAAADSFDSPELNGAYSPDPGEVQTALDDAKADGGGIVKLKPGTTYDPSAPWDVYPDVTLDCTGSEIALSTDTDVMIVHANSRVIRPIVDARSVTDYSSNVFTFDVSLSDEVYNSRKQTVIEGGRSRATPGEGVGSCLYYHQNGAGDSVTFTEVHHRIQGFQNAVEIHSENVDGWINSHELDIHIGQSTRAIYQHGPGGNKFNKFSVNYQPSTNEDADGNTDSDIFWLQEGDCQGNICEGIIWDTQYLNDVVWRLGTGVSNNNILRSETPVTTSEVDDQSGADQRQTLVTPAQRPNISAGYAAGDAAEAGDYRNTAVGDDATAGGDRSTAVGHNANAGTASTAVGRNCDASGTAAIAIGHGTDVTANYAFAFGYGNSNDVTRTIKLGDDTYHKNVFIASVDGSNNSVTDGVIPNEHVMMELDEANGDIVFRLNDSSGTYQEARLSYNG